MRRLYTGGGTVVFPTSSNEHGPVHSNGNGRVNGASQQARSVVYDAVSRQLIVTDVGDRSTNEAEYLAIIRALEHARDNALHGVRVYTDSQKCYFQITDKWPVRPMALGPLLETTRELLRSVDAEIAWIPPEENPAGHVALGSATPNGYSSIANR